MVDRLMRLGLIPPFVNPTTPVKGQGWAELQPSLTLPKIFRQFSLCNFFYEFGVKICMIIAKLFLRAIFVCVFSNEV